MLKSNIQEQVYKIQPKEEQHTEQYAISPDDKYLAIILRILQFTTDAIKLTEVQIIELESSTIVQIIRLPDKLIDKNRISSQIIKFSNDSKQLYIGDRDFIFYISTQRKQISKFKAHHYPIQDILELKHKIIMYLTYNKLKIIRKNKIIRKSKFNNYINKQLSIDYNPLSDLILIEENQEILIISLNNLKILCTHPVKFIKSALFLQNDIVTLQKRGDLRVWKICNPDQQCRLLEKVYFDDCDFEKLLILEINPKQSIIVLFYILDIFILDSRLQLIEIVKLISSDIPQYNEKYCQGSKRKVSYFEFYKQTIHIFPVVNQI